MDDSTDALIASLTSAPENEWLRQGRALTLCSTSAALAVFRAAMTRFPASSEILVGLAGLTWQAGQQAQGLQLLRAWLIDHPDDVAATFLLVRLLRDQAHLSQAGAAMRALFEHSPRDVETIIDAVELLDGYGLQRDASIICENALAAGCEDPRLHAYAGMLAIQLGDFDRTRAHYEQALAREPDAVEWNIPLGLSTLQRYRDAHHPDFAFFREVLERSTLSEYTRRSTLFALGKANDDIGDYAAAARYFGQANAMGRARSTWSRKLWKRNVEARLAAKQPAFQLSPSSDWTPVFVVGVPRSGTTLVAERLAHYPGVRNRGELGWLQTWEERLATSMFVSPTMMQEAADDIARQLRQDDDDARWIIDKQPLNLLRVDLVMALWPHARIVCCTRDPRDTALSLWTQSFHDTAHDYAYDFGDIGAVIDGCRRLEAHWRERYPASFYMVSYEQLVSEPEATMQVLAAWLEWSPPVNGQTSAAQTAIATASAWQARQPIYTRSAGRWRHYASHLPELLDIPEH